MRRYSRWLTMLAMLAAVCLLAAACSQAGGAASYAKADSLALIHCSVIDGTGAPVLDNGTVLVSKGKIEAVGKYGDVNIPKGYAKLNLKGKYVVPGFINAHVHSSYDESNFQNWLKGGVTTVRDLSPTGPLKGSYTDEKNKYNGNINDCSVVSATYIISKTGGYGGLYIDSAADAEKMVKEQVDLGADIIKISVEDDCAARAWKLLSPEEVKALTAAAHKYNKKVSAHISHVRNLQPAIDAGIDDIAHMVVEPLDSELIKKIIDKDIYWVPTMELWKGVSRIHGVDYDKQALKNLTAFYKAGGKIALGTDFNGYRFRFDSGFPITEARMMNRAGMSNMDIIIAGTKNAAHVCDMDKEIGTLEAGKRADIVIYDGNPLDDIEILAKPSMVMHYGKLAFEKSEEKSE